MGQDERVSLWMCRLVSVLNVLIQYYWTIRCINIGPNDADKGRPDRGEQVGLTSLAASLELGWNDTFDLKLSTWKFWFESFPNFKRSLVNLEFTMHSKNSQDLEMWRLINGDFDCELPLGAPFSHLRPASCGQSQDQWNGLCGRVSCWGDLNVIRREDSSCFGHPATRWAHR